MDDANYELWRIVVENAGSGDSDKRAAARRAIDALGKRGAAEELGDIARRFAGSGDSDKRAAAQRAIAALEAIER